MIQSLPTLTDAELARCPKPDDAASFGALATAQGYLPLQAMDVRARIDGLLAQVALTQTFVNTQEQPLEATYIFPLPDRAAVVRFRMEVAGRVIDGQLKERGQARAEYAQAVQAGQRAAIAEEDRPNVFNLRVGNLMPGESATVRLELSGPLPYSDGEATFRFPLVVAPRYMPGVPLPGLSVGSGTALDTNAVPDASRVSPPVLLPGYPNPVRLALSVDVHPSGLLPQDFRCSLHAALDAADGNGVRCIMLQPGERLDRDFILRFRVGGEGEGEGIRSTLALLRDAADSDEGTFALTLVPPADLAQKQRPRDVAFVLDRSGSMAGWKITAARRALAAMVETLTERDRFSVCAFDNVIETPPAFGNASLVAATDRHRFVAAEFLAGIDSRGGTEMAQPLELAAHALSAADASRDCILVLVTDGQVGNEDQILRHLGPKVGHIRIFTLGIDMAVNEGFLQRLAALGRGCCELIESEARLDEVMGTVHRLIGTPVLTGVRLEPAGFHLVPDTLVPGRLPDLFAGAPLNVLGRCRGNPGPITVQARDANGQYWSATVQPTLCTNAAVGQVWARGHIRELEDRCIVNASHAELQKRIIDTSLRFGVLCRFTAYVAVDHVIANRTGEMNRVTQAVEKPDGWADAELETADFDLALEEATEESAAYESPPMSLAARAPASAPMMRQFHAQNAPPAPGGVPNQRRAQNAPPPPAAAKPAAPSGGGIVEKLSKALRSLGTKALRGVEDEAAPADKKRASAPQCDAAAASAPAEQQKDEKPKARQEITQLTTDHSLAQALVDAKTIPAEEAGEHRFRNILWKYLGSKEVGEGPEVVTVPAQAGDRFLLCTDGLTAVVGDDQLLAFVRQQPDVQACADGLGQLALTSGSRDNVTAVVAEVTAGGTLRIGTATLVGNYREHLVDALDVKHFGDWTVCVVADGLCGQAVDEIASRRAIEVILRELMRNLVGVTSAERAQEIIRKAVVQANAEIIALKNLGTTVVLAAWRKGAAEMYVTNVGDSRCYRIAHTL